MNKIIVTGSTGFIGFAAGIWKELSVFGNDYNTVDETPISDYIYVMDMATAHVKTVQRLLDNNHISGFEVFQSRNRKR